MENELTQSHPSKQKLVLKSSDTDFIATLRYRSMEEGGRKSPAKSGYRPGIKFPFSDMQTSGRQIFIDREFVMPGETVDAEIKVVSIDHFAPRLHVGLTFEFMEGNRIIGTGTIKYIVNDELKAGMDQSLEDEIEVSHEEVIPDPDNIKIFKIRKTAGMSVAQLYDELAMGGRIMTYGYCISILAMTFRLMSAPYFIKAGEMKSKYRAKYNLRSYLFGWWGLPWGPIYTIDMLRINSEKKGGGIDVTDNVKQRLQEKYDNGDLEKVFEEDITIDYFKV
jgi:hypothetical protein